MLVKFGLLHVTCCHTPRHVKCPRLHLPSLSVIFDLDLRQPFLSSPIVRLIVSVRSPRAARCLVSSTQPIMLSRCTSRVSQQEIVPNIESRKSTPADWSLAGGLMLTIIRLRACRHDWVGVETPPLMDLGCSVLQRRKHGAVHLAWQLGCWWTGHGSTPIDIHLMPSTLGRRADAPNQHEASQFQWW